jgi:DNA-binding response OmpR family regulator
MPASNEPDLSGLRILVVEDSVLIADVIVQTLGDLGCTIIGPVPRLARGLTLATTEHLDGALLDINLAGERCFPIAEALAARGIPFAFLTGYGDFGTPIEYRGAPWLAKPFSMASLVELVARSFRVSPSAPRQG